MKRLTALIALAIGVTSVHASPDVSIFAVAGCDTATLVPVMSELNPGEILYWQNINGGGCKADRGDTGAAGKVKPEVAEPIAK